MWIGRSAHPGAVETTNPSTRALAFEQVAGVLDGALDRGRSVLVGLDFSFGYPRGTAEAMGLTSASRWWGVWEHLAHLIVDRPNNANNRFEVAEFLNREAGRRIFWGRPRGARFDGLVHLPVRNVPVEGLADLELDRFRLCERRAGSGIQSNFQLCGRGSVGGQVLVGLAWLHRLVTRYRPVAAVWPFETGFVSDPFGRPAPFRIGRETREPPSIVFAEVWPSMAGRSVPPGLTGKGPTVIVRDRAQVAAMASMLWRDGRSWFDPPSLADQDPRTVSTLLVEEGWILGVG